jgi:uncharacterized membrane protein
VLTQNLPQTSPRLSQAKVFGGIGSILVILGIIPYAGVVLAIVGLILILISLKYISDEVGDPKIFRYAMISVIVGIVGYAVLVIFVLASLLTFAVFGGNSIVTNVYTIPPGMPLQQAQNLRQQDFIGLLLAFIGVLLLAWIILIISSVFVKLSYDRISRSLGVGLFSTAALLYLIGAALMIIIIGMIIILVAAIIQAIAFFSIPETPPQRSQTQPPGSPQ